MSTVDLPEYVPGSRWKAFILSTAARGREVRIWAVDVVSGAPHHFDALEAMGLDVDNAFAYVDSNADGSVADLLELDESLTRDAAEELLRVQIPGLEFEPEGWDFG